MKEISGGKGAGCDTIAAWGGWVEIWMVEKKQQLGANLGEWYSKKKED